MIGELHATFVFDSTRLAKIGWERVAKRCRWLSVNRWALDGQNVSTGQAVTILTEEAHRDQFERARSLLSNGREIPTPPGILQVLRIKRMQVSASAPGRDVRRVIRDPLGQRIGPDGRPRGRPRPGPQG